MAVPASRRGFLAAITALAATGAPARAATAPASEITCLIERYWSARAAADEAGRAEISADERFIALGGVPDFPETVYEHEGDYEFGITHSVDVQNEPKGERERHVSAYHVDYLRKTLRTRMGLKWVPIWPDMLDEHFVHRRTTNGVDEHGVGFREPWPEAQARVDEIVAAWDWRLTEADRRRHASGLLEANAASDAACEAVWTARDTLCVTPAGDMADVVAKARFAAALAEVDPECDVPEIGLSIVEDLVRLASAREVRL